MLESIKNLLTGMLTPSTKSESVYTGTLIAIGHAMVGAAIFALLASIYPRWETMGWTFALIRLMLPLVYWGLKERGDLDRGGNFRDGIIDAVAVGLGAFYGYWWWPLLVLVFAACVTITYKKNHGG